MKFKGKRTNVAVLNLGDSVNLPGICGHDIGGVNYQLAWVHPSAAGFIVDGWSIGMPIPVLEVYKKYMTVQPYDCSVKPESDSK